MAFAGYAIFFCDALAYAARIHSIFPLDPPEIITAKKVVHDVI
jgi:hypothetical protein